MPLKPSRPRLEAMAEKIDENCRPDEQDQGQPQIFVGGADKASQQNIAEHHHHQPDIDHQTDADQGKEHRRLTQLWEQQQGGDQGTGEENCGKGNGFFKKIHG